MSNYLGIDLGTSSIKVSIVNRQGKVLFERMHAYEVIENNNGWLEQNPEVWLAGLQAVVNDIKKTSPLLLETVKSISVTGQMHGIVPVDRTGTPLHNAIIWSDRRNEQELQTLHALLTNEEWVSITGNRPNISFTIGKIMWFKKHFPDLYDQVYKFLLPKDFIRLHLTGIFATDYSDASATLLIDLTERSWSEKIINLVDLDFDKLPEIKESTDIVGYITDEANKNYGLKQGVAVICGCGDALAQALGNGVVSSNDWLCTIGTSGQVIASTDELIIEKEGLVHTLAHAERDKWVLMGATLSAGMSLKWFTDAFFDESVELKHILNRVLTVNPKETKLIFQPYLYGERSPYMDEKAKASFIGFTNEYDHTHAARAVVEGVLFSLYQCFNIIKKTTGLNPQHIILTGGAASHEAWAQTAADIFQIPIVRKVNRGGGAYGAAMLAAVGVGDYNNLDELVNHWGLMHHENMIHPNESLYGHYEKMYRIYEKSYDALKEIFHDLQHGN